MNSTADTCVYSGGVGAGKSISDVAIAIKWAIEYPGIDLIVATPTYVMLYDTILREFRENCPEQLLSKFNVGAYPEAIFKYVPGFKESTVRFRAFRDAGRAKGPTYGGAILDEANEIDEDITEEIMRRVRQKGMPNRIRLSTNPGSKLSYFYQRFIEPAELGLAPVEQLQVIHTTSFDNTKLPKIYVDRLKLLALTRPAHYQRAVLGKWGDFDEDTIGAFQTTDRFHSEYLVAFLDTSFSDSTASDRTALSIVGFIPDANPANFWKIEFTGKSWQKSITDTVVIEEMMRFLDIHKPIEVCVESQLGDSTKTFIDRFRQCERDLGVSPKNHWTTLHQTKNKHERIMLHVAGNKDRIRVLDGTEASFLNPIVAYAKGAKHEDEIDATAGAINQWQTSKILRNYMYEMERLRGQAS